MEYMTIALTMKVHDGIVLGADSATTLSGPVNEEGKPGIWNVYNNAAKIFNLYRGLPIAGMTWGQGNIGEASISTLAKDLRKRFQGEDRNHLNWKLQEDSYSLEEVAKQTFKFFMDEHYAPTFKELTEKPQFGFLVAGYCPQREIAQEWIFNQFSTEPAPLRTDHASGLNWFAQPEAISRLVCGVSPLASAVFVRQGASQEEANNLQSILQRELGVTVAPSFMPIQDAIDLANFLLDTTIKFARFTPGTATVGGPIEIATITKHEGFKWIQRKHFYEKNLNQ